MKGHTPEFVSGLNVATWGLSPIREVEGGGHLVSRGCLTCLPTVIVLWQSSLQKWHHSPPKVLTCLHWDGDEVGSYPHQRRGFGNSWKIHHFKYFFPWGKPVDLGVDRTVDVSFWEIHVTTQQLLYLCIKNCMRNILIYGNHKWITPLLSSQIWDPNDGRIIIHLLKIEGSRL